MEKQNYNQNQGDPVQYLNQTYSNRVLRAEFDKNWEAKIQSDYVIYTAVADYAKMLITILDGSNLLVIFKCGGQVWVDGYGTTYYGKPHIVKMLD